MSQHTTQSIEPPNITGGLTKALGPNAPLYLMAACLPFLFWMIWSGRHKKAELGRARMATDAEVKKSTAAAVENINNPNELTLWAGMPDKFSMSPDGKIAFKPGRETVLFRKANEHMMVYGGAGAGKSRYFLNRLAESAILCKMPLIVVDMKGDEEQYKGKKVAPSSEIGGFALKHGYEVFRLAPFYPDSDQLNPIDLLRHPKDSATAKQFCRTMATNGLPSGSKLDQWDESGAQFLAGGMLAAAQLEQGRDFSTVEKILARFAADPTALERANLPQAVKIVFSQFLASARSPETAASVAFSALRMLGDVLLPEITAVCCNKTTIPIVLKQKQMLIIRVDPVYAEVLMPILSAIIEVILSRNVFSGSPYGGLAILDELPQYRLTKLPKIQAVARSKRWCFAMAAQGESILADEYGERATEAILENCQTVAVMRISSNKTAKNYSDALGKDQVETRNKTQGKGGGSSTVSEQVRDLVPPEELQQQPTGRCILYTPTVTSTKMQGGIKGEERVRIPYRCQFKVSRREQHAINEAHKIWRRKRPEWIASCTARPLTERQLQAREDLVNRLFPIVDKAKSQDNPEVKEKLNALFSAKRA